MEVLDPERGTLDRDSNNLPDVVGLRIHPDVAKKQAVFLTLWNDVQHVLWNSSKVLLAQEDEVIIGSADGALVACLGGSYFLFQNAVTIFSPLGLPCASVILNVLMSGGVKLI